MIENQQPGQGSNASSGNPSGANQQNQSARQGQQAMPGGVQPGSQQGRSGRSDPSGAALDEEDITQSPRRDASLQQGGDDSNRRSGQQSR